jgi:glycosyltransferase involved in cell wall biosynthesis
MLKKLSRPDVSIVIPAYEEEKTISEVLQRLLKVCKSMGRVEIIVVDDGSTDRTGEKVVSFPTVTYIRHKKNMGKGAALQTGINYSRGKILVIQDADLEYLPEIIPSLVRPISDGSVDIVYGSRFSRRPKGMSLSHFLGNSILSIVTRFMYNIKITDIMTGQKAFRRSVLDSIDLKENGFAVEIEITCLSFNCSRRFAEVYIPYSYRNHGVSKLVNFDGFKSLAMLFNLFLRTDASDIQKAPQLSPNIRLKTTPKLSTGHTDLRETS